MGSEPSAALRPSNQLSCPLLEKIPPEIRVKIYNFLWSDRSSSSPTDSTTERRIYWKGAGTLLPSTNDALILKENVRHINDRTPRLNAPRLGPLDTGLLRTCKQLYDEAIVELVAKNTVVIEVGSIDLLPSCPNILNSMRRIEIRDTKHSKGSQISIPARFNGPGKEFLQSIGVTHLRKVKDLLERTAGINHVVLGFELLHVTLYFYEIMNIHTGPSFQSVEDQFQIIYAEAGLNRSVCSALGTWRLQYSTSQVLEVKHFNISKLLEWCAESPCECRGSYFRLMELYKAYQPRDGKSANNVYLAHIWAKAGILGKEAERRCGGDGSKSTRSLLDKTWAITIRAAGWSNF